MGLRAKYVLRFDDIAPNMRWSSFDRLRVIAARYDVRPLLGVIPDNADPELLRFPRREEGFWSEIRSLAAAGWEIAVHGLEHRWTTSDAGLLGVNPRSEFAGLPFEAQLDKLRRALSIFREHGLAPRTFMPPAHSFDRDTLRSLRAVGLQIVTDGYARRPYREDGIIFVPQMFAWPRPMPPGIYTACIHLNELGPVGIDRLERVVRRYRRDIIDFEEAIRHVDDRWTNRAVGTAIHGLLRGVRTARRLTAPRSS